MWSFSAWLHASAIGKRRWKVRRCQAIDMPKGERAERAAGHDGALTTMATHDR